MLKRITVKRLLITSSAIMALFLIYLIPSENTYHLKDIKQNLEYVNASAEMAEVYLLNKNDYLTRASVSVTTNKEDIGARATELLQYLILSSKMESKIPSGFKAYLPEGTEIQNVRMENGVLKVEMNEQVLDIDEKLEEKMVEGIVYTLTGIDGVDKVILYVNGSILTKLPKTKLNLPNTLDRSFGINKDYQITSYKDVKKVTVYYLDSFNDNYYYVPVTKYLNDSRDKISIIIDELTASSSYDTNLMSFLNSNTKLMSFNQSDDVLNLVFNSYIFDDVDTRSVLEEVIYTISLSVADNYDVKEVSFTVNDKEIYKSVLKTIE
ncbi:MAG: GerMN domain-containing protein [Bacilli bacterium]|nr:GerMN domain-containing protein [Bacilli bacterium]